MSSHPSRQDSLLKHFEAVWTALFTTPVHLDSALSRLPPAAKTKVAPVIQEILLRPCSLARALRVRIAEGEPWSLKAEELARWAPASIIAERLLARDVRQGAVAGGGVDDFPPEWVVEWKKNWGEPAALELVRALSEEPPLGLRASARTGALGLRDELVHEISTGLKPTVSEIAPFGLRFPGYVAVLGTESFRQGKFEIQDEGSQLMALFALWPSQYAAFLSDRPGPAPKRETVAPPALTVREAAALTVVDACAGAGGKTLALADVLKGRGRIYAYDTSEGKLRALKKRAVRGGYNNVQTLALSEGAELEQLRPFAGRASVVLVDAPCSGLGVLRRNPDIKWRRGPDDAGRLPALQERLLATYGSLVAPGGRLVFGVCTFRPSETRELVARFLAAHPEFEAREGGYLGPDPCDGFFMQAFVRKGGGV